MSSWGDIAQIHPHLTVLDLTHSSTILPFDSCRALPFLHKAAFVNDPNPRAIPHLLHDHCTQLLTHGVRFPIRPVQQMLHSVTMCLAHDFRYLPTILTWNIPQQSTYI